MHKWSTKVKKILVDPRSKLALANASSQFVLIATLPIYSRIFTQADFGIASIVLFFIQVFSIVGSARYEVAILNPKSERVAQTILALSVLITCSLTAIILIATVVYVNSGWVSAENYKYVWAVPIGFFLVSIYNVYSFWFTRSQSFDLISISKVFQSIIGGLSPIFMAGTISGALAIIIGAIIGRSFGIFIYIIGKKRKLDIEGSLRTISSRKLIGMAKKHVSFPLYSAPQSLINTVTMAGPPMLFSVLVGAGFGGEFFIAHRSMLACVVVIGASFGSVLMGSIKGKRHPSELAQNVLSNHVSLIKIAPAFVFLVGFGIWRFSELLLGSDWDGIGLISIILIAPTLAHLISSPLTGVIGLLEKNRENLQANLIFLIIRSLSFLSVFLVAPIVAVTIFSAVSTITYVMYSIYMFRLTEIKFYEYIRFTGKVWIANIIGCSIIVILTMLSA